MAQEPYVVWLSDQAASEVDLVGGKNASLSQMIRELGPLGIRVPPGFAVTTRAYSRIVDANSIEGHLCSILSDVDASDVPDLEGKSGQIRRLFRRARIPEEISAQIVELYNKMCEDSGYEVEVAVRSSANMEDQATASFAGQLQTFLNVVGEDRLLEAVLKCMGSLYSPRAISYHFDKGLDPLATRVSVCVQKMVRSDSACAGVMFTLDPESGAESIIHINAAYGLGENVVQGTVNPDEYYVHKATLLKGKRSIVGKRLGEKKRRMVYSAKATTPVRNVTVPKKEQRQYALSDDEILELARWGCTVEERFAARFGKVTPMDIEWGKDGNGEEVGTGRLYLLQARPETVHSAAGDYETYETYYLKRRGRILASGRAIGQKVGAGEVVLLNSIEEIRKFRPGKVLVTKMTDPDWEPIMKMASAIVTDKGGRTCHAAIVSRELGIPCITGTGNATDRVRDGSKITVSCCEGLEGHVYEGLLEFGMNKMRVKDLPKTRTKIMMNVGIPDTALTHSRIPSDGVGLARLEFIINSYVGIHPLALIKFEEIRRKKKSARMTELIQSIEHVIPDLDDKPQFFVDCLARGIGRIGAAFFPKDVIVRLSDFKSNEYAKLLGGTLFEPRENNPMIGWRGASRYYDERFRPAFELECAALLKVREEMGLTNVKAMVPFCRTPEEGEKVVGILKQAGLVSGKDGFEVYMMAEIPSNVILAERFAQIFDGFSIGSNDLTQLILGLDRDSDLLIHLYSERSEPVKWAIDKLIRDAKNSGKKVGICGQAPSDFPDFARFLVDCGIDSISLNPDTVIKTRLDIAEYERSEGILPA
jgi:pyruvate,water dikinase